MLRSAARVIPLSFPIFPDDLNKWLKKPLEKLERLTSLWEGMLLGEKMAPVRGREPTV